MRRAIFIASVLGLTCSLIAPFCWVLQASAEASNLTWLALAGAISFGPYLKVASTPETDALDRLARTSLFALVAIQTSIPVYFTLLSLVDPGFISPEFAMIYFAALGIMWCLGLVASFIRQRGLNASR